MYLRGLRGATTVVLDDVDEVFQATVELLTQMQARNQLLVDDVAAVLFTVTPDIRSMFPAQAARVLGWDQVPLLCFQEMSVTGALPFCIRVLILFNTEKNNIDIHPVYLRGAKVLRPDLL